MGNIEFLGESIQFDRLTPSRINRTSIILPRGIPVGRNVVLTILCRDIHTTMERIQDRTTVQFMSPYRYFIKPYTVQKSIMGIKRLITTDRKITRTFCASNQMTWVTKPMSDMNAIVDVSTEMSLYFDRLQNRPITTIIDQFIPYLQGCIPHLPKTTTQRNIILIDALDYPFNKTTKLAALKSNPIYAIYRLLRDHPDVFSGTNLEFVLMGHGNSIYINPSKMNQKTIKQFFTNLFLFMNTTQKYLDQISKQLDSEITPVVDIPVKDNQIQSAYRTVQAKASPPDKTPSDSKSPSLSIVSDDDMAQDDPEDILDRLDVDVDEISGEDEENDPIGSNQPEEDSASEQDIPEDEQIFTVDDDEDPFAEIEKPKKKKPAQIKSKLIEPGSKKQEQLLQAQQKIVVRPGKTIQDEENIVPGNIPVPTSDHTKSVQTHNEDVSHSRYENYRKTYMDQGFDSDMVKAFTSLNTKDNAFYIQDIKITDHSDSMNYLEQWEVTVVDQYGTKSIIRLDIPKLYDNKYFYIQGNLKTLENQSVPLPIVKTGPNRVIITTNYNKIFMERYDTRTTIAVSKLTKLISYDTEHKYFTPGNNRIDNQGYDIPLSMSEIAKQITTFRTTDCQLHFNMKLPIMQKHNPEENSKTVWIGTVGGQPIILDKSTGRTSEGKSVMDIILDHLPEEYQDVYNSVKVGHSYMYARMKMNMKQVPCLFIVSYWVGLQSILEKSGISYHFTPDDSGRGKVPSNQIRVKFADGCLYYENSELGELLLNPLLHLNTKDISFPAMNNPETWEDILVDIYGSYKSLNVIKAFHEWMIDWITLEILQMYKLPETIDELIIYGIKMLADNQYTSEISDENQRMRHAEVLPAMVYYRLATQYAKYVSTGGRSKMTLPPDAIIKDLLSLTTLEDASIINPVLEISKDSSISKRGYRGTNLDSAYTKALRTYSEDSIGKLAMSTATGPNVGVQKYLTHEPDILNIRGIRENTTPVDEMTGPNVMSTAEMLVPMAVMHDDATRVAMSIKQSGHVVPSEVSSPSLLSNGADETLRFRLSSEYVINAEADGKVVEYDEKSGMMVVQYQPYTDKPGHFRAFKLTPDVVKNSGGGIYFSKQLVSPLKVGDTFKKDDVLAYHDKFFTYTKGSGLCYNIGPLVRVCLHATSEAYEDGGWITEDVAQMMATAIVYKEEIQLNREANLTHVAKIGDDIQVDDKLISYTSGTHDDQLNRLLASLDDSTAEDLQMGKRSEHGGIIVDIIIYSQVDPEDCSPSVKKLLTEYRARVNRVNNILSRYDKSEGIVKAGYMNRQPETDVKSKYGKIKGLETDILIEFYVKHVYPLSIGDKLVLYSANKNTVSKVIKEDMAGWSENNPDDPIQGAISPSPLSKRMLSSPICVLANTTCLIELKRKMIDIWKS